MFRVRISLCGRIFYFGKIILFFGSLFESEKLGLFLRFFEIERVGFWCENVVIKWSGKWLKLGFWNFGKKSIFTEVGFWCF